MKAHLCLGLAAALMTAGAGGPAPAAGPAPAERDHPATDPTKLVKEGDRAAARRDWETAARDYGEAVKLVPDDARLRDKHRRALDRRARACEARAAKPPPTPQPIPPMFGGHSDSLDVLRLRDERWHTQLTWEASDARADAEAARPRPDEARIARLRADAAEKRKQDQRLTAQILQQQAKDEATRSKNEREMETAFEGVRGIGVGAGPTDAASH